MATWPHGILVHRTCIFIRWILDFKYIIIIIIIIIIISLNKPECKCIIYLWPNKYIPGARFV